MDPNLIVLLVLVAPTAIIGGVVAVLASDRVRELGLYGVLRRAIGSDSRNPYGRLLR